MKPSNLKDIKFKWLGYLVSIHLCDISYVLCSPTSKNVTKIESTTVRSKYEKLINSIYILDWKEKSIEKDQHQSSSEMNDAQFVVNGPMDFTTMF